jgi:hypothetical protein
MHSSYNPELSRAMFKRAQFYYATERQEDAKIDFHRAKILYYNITNRDKEEPTLADFDSIVRLWAR